MIGPEAGRFAALLRRRRACRLTIRSVLGIGAALYAGGVAPPAAAVGGADSSPTPGSVMTGPASASGPRVAPGVQSGPNDIRLLGQSTDVEAGHAWQVHMAVTAAVPDADRLRVQVFNRLTTRTAFDQSLHGHVTGGEAWHSGTIDLNDLPRDTGGGVTLAVPIDREGTDPNLTDFSVSRGQSGIFPVQVELVDSAGHTLRTLTTYLVFVAGTSSQTGFPRLDVSTSLDLGAPPPIPSSAALTARITPTAVSAAAGVLPASTLAALRAEVAILERHRGVPISLTVTPETADALAARSRVSPATGPGPGASQGVSATTSVPPTTAPPGTAGPPPTAASGAVAPTTGASATTIPAGNAGFSGTTASSAHLRHADHSRSTPPSSTLVSSAPAASAAAVLGGLSGLVSGHDELLPSTYVTTALSAMAQAGLSRDIDEQFAKGSASLATELHQVPSNDTWVVDGPLDAVTLRLLEARGVTKLIVPAVDLQALPKALRTFTVAAPAQLAGTAGKLTVDAADSQLSAHFSDSPDQVLAANQLLAELAMIQLETPSRHRGVAVVPPAGWVANDAFLDTLLGGLQANPLIQPVTADQLFAAIPAATGRSQATRSLVPQPPAAPLADAPTIKLARAAAEGFGAVLPGATTATAEMARRILISESADLSSAQRNDVLGPVVASASPLNRGISLPRSTSITLTARKGSLPLTILDTPSLKAHVELRLSSDKLNFEPFSPAGGHCVRPSASSEICQMVLTVGVTTIKVPVEARTSGVFTLNVGIYSPNGSLAFGTNRDTVRSTAVSGVGVILIILAALGLGYWWLRSIRHGRRARQLVAVTEGGNGSEASDLDRAQAQESGKGSTDDHDVGATVSGGDVFADFFSSPAPEYPMPAPSPPVAPPVSPSPGRAGPT